MQAVPVTVTKIALVIEGGHMKQPWAPKDVRVIDGRAFVRLSKADRRLAAFVGADLKHPHPLDADVWLSGLLALRNAAVTATEVARREAEDSGPLPPRKEWIEDAPRVVTVQVPGFVSHGEDVPGQLVPMLVPMDARECVAVEASPETLEFIRRGVRSTMGKKTKRRPAAEERVTFEGCPAVHYNKARHSVYVFAKDKDGRKRHRSFPRGGRRATADDKQEAAQKAQRWYDALPASWDWGRKDMAEAGGEAAEDE